MLNLLDLHPQASQNPLGQFGRVKTAGLADAHLTRQRVGQLHDRCNSGLGHVP